MVDQLINFYNYATEQPWIQNLFEAVKISKKTVGRLIEPADTNTGGFIYKQLETSLQGYPSRATLDLTQRSWFSDNILKNVTMAEESTKAAIAASDEMTFYDRTMSISGADKSDLVLIAELQ